MQQDHVPRIIQPAAPDDFHYICIDLTDLRRNGVLHGDEDGYNLVRDDMNHSDIKNNRWNQSGSLTTDSGTYLTFSDRSRAVDQSS
ncbi:unnamed protein product, partial [Rotaria sp. Silwood2]